VSGRGWQLWLREWTWTSAAWWMILHGAWDGWRVHDIIMVAVGAGFLTTEIILSLTTIALAARKGR
jgi:hypothetical protein